MSASSQNPATLNLEPTFNAIVLPEFLVKEKDWIMVPINQNLLAFYKKDGNEVRIHDIEKNRTWSKEIKESAQTTTQNSSKKKIHAVYPTTRDPGLIIFCSNALVFWRAAEPIALDINDSIYLYFPKSSLTPDEKYFSALRHTDYEIIAETVELQGYHKSAISYVYSDDYDTSAMIGLLETNSPPALFTTNQFCIVHTLSRY